MTVRTGTKNEFFCLVCQETVASKLEHTKKKEGMLGVPASVCLHCLSAFVMRILYVYVYIYICRRVEERDALRGFGVK